MARPKAPVGLNMAAAPVQMEQVSGNTSAFASVAGSSALYKRSTRGEMTRQVDDRNQIAKRWQIEAYRQVNICGEARYSASLFASLAGRAEIGVSQAQALARKPTWLSMEEAPDEVAAFAELAPTVRERSKLIRDYVMHRVIAGECYLIARTRQRTDPGYVEPGEIDLMDEDAHEDVNSPLWEIVGVTELRKNGGVWEVRHDNDVYIPLSDDDPVIRIWVPDPSQRREAWSPFRSLLPTLKEIEWLTKHIFTQVRSRLMSAGVWFLPDNLTFAPPPPDAVEGGAEAIAEMNEAEQFMLSLAESAMGLLDEEEVSFPTVVLTDPAALAAVDQRKLIQFWSEIDDKAMMLRSDAVRRFALGMDLPPEQILGSSGVAISGSGGSAGSVNHWGEWANEEKTIAAHIEPALDDFVSVLTYSFLRRVVPDTEYVIAYDPTSIRMKQDRSKEALELYDRGLLNAETAVREIGFDPENDMMDDKEFQRWLLTRLAGGSATPEQVQAAFLLLTNTTLPASTEETSAPEKAAPGLPGPALPRNLDGHPVRGRPQEDHEHNDAPYSGLMAYSEGLVLRALEKAGNRLLNDGKRGRDKDRMTPAHLAHVAHPVTDAPTFDFGLLPTVFEGYPAAQQVNIEATLTRYCASLYAEGAPHTRDALRSALRDGIEGVQ